MSHCSWPKYKKGLKSIGLNFFSLSTYIFMAIFDQKCFTYFVSENYKVVIPGFDLVVLSREARNDKYCDKSLIQSVI